MDIGQPSAKEQIWSSNGEIKRTDAECGLYSLSNESYTAPFFKKEVSAKKMILRWQVLYGHLLLIALVRGFIL